MSKAIVSLVTYSERYYQQIERLRQSLKSNFSGPFYDFIGEESVHAPAHILNNYAFKVFSITHLKKAGFMQIFWIDSSCYAVKPIQPIFDYLDREGIFLESSGRTIGDWSNDECLEYFKITREQAHNIEMISSGFVGLDFDKEISKEFFYRWQETMCMGLFNGSWDNHRHDQTCASIIAWQMGLKLLPDNTYFAYVGLGYKPPRETAVFHLQGI